MKRKNIFWALTIPLVTVAGGISCLMVGCSSNNVPSTIVDYPTTIEPNKPVSKLINLGPYLSKISSFLNKFSTANSESSLFVLKNEILHEINSLFNQSKFDYDVVLNFRYSLIDNNDNNKKEISNLNLTLNNDFAYQLDGVDQKDFGYNIGSRSLEYKNNIKTNINTKETINSGISNFDSNIDNKYGVFFTSNTDGYLENGSASFEVTTPSLLPNGFSNSNTKKKYSIYYNENFDETNFKKFVPVNTNEILGNTKGNFIGGETINFSKIKNPGLYLINFNFLNIENKKEVNLLCGYKIFDSLENKDIGDWNTPRSLTFPIKNTVTTTFNFGDLEVNGIVVDEENYGVLNKKESLWDLSNAQSGQYSVDVGLIDTNPFTKQYCGDRTIVLSTMVKNPLKNVEFNVSNLNFNDNTATLSLSQKNTKNDTKPRLEILEDSLQKNSKLAMVGLYKDNNLDDNQTNWIKIENFDDVSKFKSQNGFNKELKNIQNVNVVLGKNSISENGSSFTITVSTGNGYRFNVDNPVCFSSYKNKLNENINITQDNPNIKLPTKEVTYTLEQGGDIGSINSDVIGQPIIGTEMKFSVSFNDNTQGSDVTWQYQNSDGNWIDFPKDICGVQNTSNTSTITIPNRYNDKLCNFSIRVISFSFSWMPTKCANFQVQRTPNGIYRIDKNNHRLLGFQANINDELAKVGTFVLPSGCEGIADNAFKGNQYIKKLIIPEQYRTLGRFAFYGCSNLINVDANNSNLTKIDFCAFENCNKLQNVKINETHIITIEDYAFKATNLRDFVAPSSLSSIGIESFMNITESPNFTFDITKCKNGVKINRNAFWNAKSLTNFLGTENISLIGQTAFVNATKINPNGNGIFIFGNKLTSISNDAIACNRDTNKNYDNIEYFVFNTPEELTLGNQCFYFERIPNLQWLFFNNSDTWIKFKNKVSTFQNNHILPSKFNILGNYGGYITLSKSDSTSITNKAILDIKNNNFFIQKYNEIIPVNLTFKIPSNIPCVNNKYQILNTTISYKFYYSKNINEMDQNNFYEIVDNVQNNQQINKSELGITSSISGNCELNQSIILNNIKKPGTYKIIVNYLMQTTNSIISISEFNTKTVLVLDNINN